MIYRLPRRNLSCLDLDQGMPLTTLAGCARALTGLAGTSPGRFDGFLGLIAQALSGYRPWQLNLPQSRHVGRCSRPSLSVDAADVFLLATPSHRIIGVVRPAAAV